DLHLRPSKSDRFKKVVAISPDLRVDSTEGLLGAVPAALRSRSPKRESRAKSHEKSRAWVAFRQHSPRCSRGDKNGGAAAKSYSGDRPYRVVFAESVLRIEKTVDRTCN